MEQTRQDLIQTIESLKDFLLEKNRRYGDSAIHPIKIFSKAENVDGILVRIDDKLSRIKNNCGDIRMNDIVDLIGYLVLFCVGKGWNDFSELID